MRKFLFVFTLCALNVYAQDVSNKRYNEVRYLMTHNSTSTRPGETKFGDFMRTIVNKIPIKKVRGSFNELISATTLSPSAVADQTKGIEAQLSDGVRAFKLPINFTKPEFRICHTVPQSKLQGVYDKVFNETLKKVFPAKMLRKALLSPLQTYINDPCKLDPATVSLSDTLSKINRWLDKNPNEIVTFFFDFSQVKGDIESAQATQNAFKNVLEKSGILNKMYVKKDAKSPWPTIGEMIKDNKRVVIVANTRNFVPLGIWHKEDLGFGTDYSYPKSEDLIKNSENPKIKWGPVDKNRIFIVDNYTTPRASGSIVASKIVNKYDVLKKRLQNYEKLAGQPVTFTMIDFYEQPANDAIKVIKDLNEGK